jgi:uncharacterized protein YegL
MTEPLLKSKCLPTYLVIDTSRSMEKDEQVLNDTVDYVFDKVDNSPRVSEFAHISIITFNTDAHLVLEMADIEQVDQLPLIKCGGATSYGKMFQLVKERIDIDVEKLNAGGSRAVLRPAVFILTDGGPTDPNWASQFDALTDPGWRRRPHIITYGFGQANAAVLGKISTMAAFMAENIASDEDAIATALMSLLNTLVASAGAEELRIPEQVDGYIRVPLEYMD